MFKHLEDEIYVTLGKPICTLNMRKYFTENMILRKGIGFSRCKFLLITMVGLIWLFMLVWLYAVVKFETRTTFSKLMNLESGNTTQFPEHQKADSIMANIRNSEYSVSQQKCVQPTLDPYNPAVMEHYHKAPPISCSSATKDWVHVKDGNFHISPDAIQLYSNITCEYVPILRDGDFRVKYGPKIKPMIDGAPLTSDFFHVFCESAKGKTYSKIHAAVARNTTVMEHLRSYNSPATKKNPETEGRSTSDNVPPSLAADDSALPPVINSLNLSVFMLGFDSLSHMAWTRHLSKTRKYYLDTLGGIELEGYNIVGDGTPSALLPILTGKTEAELPEARRGYKGAKPVDNHPWIWKEFSKHGYVTAYSEDLAFIGTFHYRMLGFADQPTDHFPRPYFLATEKTHHQHPRLCLGSVPRHVIFMNWFRDLFDTYKDNPKFFFGFHSELTHNSQDETHLLDDDLVRFLQDLETKGHLNNTLLILMSDHGARFHHLRLTAQGRLEERLPYFSFRFPSWFHKRYPDIVQNVRINAKRLTNPFDIYATLRNILNFASENHGDVNNRGISLFKEIPKERTCAHADIFPHWCACMQWEIVNNSDPLVLSAVDSAIKKINDFTKHVRGKCVELQLLNITSSNRHVSNARDSKRKPRPSTGDLYQVTFTTTPGQGIFEVTCEYQAQSGSFIVNSKEISRINRYGSQPACIAKKLPSIRKYCYCV